MADSTRIEEIISQAALKGFDELNAKVNASILNVERLVTSAVELNSAFANVASLRDFNKGVKEIKVSEDELRRGTLELEAVQAKLNNTLALQEQKKAINELIIKNKELTNAIKEQELLKVRSLELDRLSAKEKRALAAEEKAQLAAQLAAGREKIIQIHEQITTQEKLIEQSQQQLPTGFTNQRAQLIKSPVIQTQAFIPANDLEESIHLLQRNELALQQNQAAQKQLTKDLQAGKISQAEYDAQINKAIQQELEFKAAIAATSAELKLQSHIDLSPEGTLARAKAENKQLSAKRDLVDPADVAQIKLLNDQIDKNNELIDLNSAKLEKQKINIGNYPKLFTIAFEGLHTELKKVQTDLNSGAFSGKQLDDLKAKEASLIAVTSLEGKEFATTTAAMTAHKQAAIQLGLAYGKDSAIFQTFSAEIAAAEAKLNSLSTTAQVAGTKAAGAGNLLQKAFTGLRNIAYILPGIGIAGLIGILIDPITTFIGKLFESKTALKDTQTVLDESKSSYANAAAQVNELKTNIQLAKEGFIDKDKVVRQYNETIGKTTGQVTNLKDAEEQLIKNADAYIKFTFLKAAATTAQAKAGQEAVDAELENQKELEKIRRINEPGAAKADVAAGTAGLSEFLSKGVDNERKATEKANKKRVDQLNSIGAKFEKDAAEIAKKFKFDFFGGTEDGKAEKSTEKIKAVNKKFFADELKDTADALKAISKDQDIYLTDRINKRKEAFAIEQSLIKQQTAIEIQTEKDKLKAVQDSEAAKGVKGSKVAVINAENEYREKIKEINEKSDYTLRKLETTLSGDLLQIENTYNAKRLADDKKANDDFISQNNKLNEDRKKNEIAAINTRSERELAAIDRDRDVRLKAIQDEENKLLSSTDGSDARQKIEEKAQRKSLAVEIEVSKLKIEVALNTQRALLAIADIKDQDTIEKTKAKIAELEKQLAELNGKNAKISIDVDISKLDKFLSAIDKIREGVLATFDVIGGAINASIITQKNLLRDQSDLIERNSQKEIEAINASADTVEKKAARVQLVNARTQAQKEIIAQRQRQLDQRAAEFEKAKTIVEIILNTASAVIKGLKTGGPVLAALYGALGAAQLAVAIATPVPRFEHGTMDAPGGLAYVGEKRKELIVTPDGRMIETPGTAVMMTIPKHSQVYPDMKKLLERGIGKRPLVHVSQKDSTAMFYFLGGKLDKLDRTIKNKTETHISRKGDGWEQIKKSGGNQTKYL